MQLRYLKKCILQISSPKKQSNGLIIENFENVSEYKIMLQELIDEVSANIYGANINKTFRIASPYHKLENFLYNKVSNDSDNISKYYILLNNKRYKIVSVKANWVDIELL